MVRERSRAWWAARAAGGTVEGVWSVLGMAGEPPVTRSVASQVATPHPYRWSRPGPRLAARPPLSGEEAFARATVYWMANLPAAG